jgi:hypothetical protein
LRIGNCGHFKIYRYKKPLEDNLAIVFEAKNRDFDACYRGKTIVMRCDVGVSIVG